MEVWALGANFEPVRLLEYTNLQWQRKYYPCGTFIITIPAAAYSPDIEYIDNKSRPEVGMVQKLIYKYDRTGPQVELSGFFLEKLIGDKVVNPHPSATPDAYVKSYVPFKADGNMETEIRRMIDTYKGDIPRLKLGPVAGLGSDATWQEDEGRELDMICTERLQSQQLSYRCLPGEDGDIYFDVWQGLDRTQDQTKNSPALFSDRLGNINTAEITIDRSNHKNYAILAGALEGINRKVKIVDNSDGGYQKQIFISSSESYDQDAMAERTYLAILGQEGTEQLATNYCVIENANITLTGLPVGRGKSRRVGEPAGIIYRQDFDLGDLCNVVISKLGVEMSARIIAANEVVKNNTHTVDLELGEEILTRTQKTKI